jgi:hypothetical protein
VAKKEWFDTAASGLRHLPGIRPEAPVLWTDSLYTFNTSCYGWSAPVAAESWRSIATRPIKEYLPRTRIIALSTYNEPERIGKMYKAGAGARILPERPRSNSSWAGP